MQTGWCLSLIHSINCSSNANKWSVAFHSSIKLLTFQEHITNCVSMYILVVSLLEKGNKNIKILLFRFKKNMKISKGVIRIRNHEFKNPGINSFCRNNNIRASPNKNTFTVINSVSEWLLFNANSAIFQPYHGVNKLL